MAARHRGAKKYADGGKITGVPVPGASVIKEAESDSDGFKKGGKITLATGGKAGMNLGKAPRKAAGGPVVKLARGGSPFSAAKSGGSDAPDKGAECS